MKALISEDASSILLVSLSTPLDSPLWSLLELTKQQRLRPEKHFIWDLVVAPLKKEGAFLEEKCEIVKRDDADKSPVCDNLAPQRIFTMGNFPMTIRCHIFHSLNLCSY